MNRVRQSHERIEVLSEMPLMQWLEQSCRAFHFLSPESCWAPPSRHCTCAAGSGWCLMAQMQSPAKTP